MHRTEAVGEARVLGALVGEVGEAELPHSSQSLEFSGIDQADEKPALLGVSLQLDYVVDRVPIISFHLAKMSRRVRFNDSEGFIKTVFTPYFQLPLR